jgi:hypothetical protein
LETIKEQYLHDAEFKNVLQNCRDGRTWNKFILNDGFVFHANKLCILDGFVHLLLLHEDVLVAHVFWPHMQRDAERFMACGTTLQIFKSLLNPRGLYIPLPVPSVPWEEISCFGIASYSEGEG